MAVDIADIRDLHDSGRAMSGVFHGPRPVIHGMRDPRYSSPHRFDVRHDTCDAKTITNLTPFSNQFQTMTAALEHWSVVTPDRIWLAERSGEGWHAVTFREACERIGLLAAGLRGMGVIGKGPLLILASNTIDHALICYAMMGQGGVAAPVSPQYGLPGANLGRLTQACSVLKPAAVYTEDAALFAAGLAADCLAGLPVIVSRNPRPGDIPIEALYSGSPIAATAAPEDDARYLLTSGSTGVPKAVRCAHREIALNTAQAAACFDDPDPPVIVNCAPWSHSMGAHSVLHMTAHRGATFYIDRGQPTAARFGETLRNLKDIAPTFHNMVPAGLMMLADELERDDALARVFFDRLRLIQNGGAAVGQTVADRIEAVALRTVGERITFASGYGATETGPTICNVHWANLRMGMLGLPIPGTTVRLVPLDGKLEVRVKGPQVTKGYLGRPELTAAAFDDEGYYRLGDAARPLDPADPVSTLVYDGRLSENFKLASGTFVGVGDLRIRALSAVGSAATDAVVCGEGEESVGLLLYPNLRWDRGEIAAAVATGIVKLNAQAKGQGGRIGRAMILPGAPDGLCGEVTDKGYIAQSVARRVRAAAIAELFAAQPAPDVLLFPADQPRA